MTVEFEAVSVVDQAVEDGIGECGFVDDVVPCGNRELAGDQDRAAKAAELRAFLDQRQSLVGGILLVLGLGGVAISLVRRSLTPEPEPW